jgi:hypothetical protein
VPKTARRTGSPLARLSPMMSHLVCNFLFLIINRAGFYYIERNISYNSDRITIKGLGSILSASGSSADVFINIEYDPVKKTGTAIIAWNEK